MFPRNYWYVAAFSDELDDGPLARTLLNEPVALFRTESGRPVAMLDRCPHRDAPLSLGTIIGEELQCVYHGIRYGADGACVRIPGQDHIPAGAGAKTFPLIERWGWVFIWMGDAARADESLLPDFHHTDSPGWKAKGVRFPLAGNYKLMVDNLLDLSHLSYLHMANIGSRPIAETPAKTERTERGVKISRYTLSSPAPKFWTETRGLSGTIDRWSVAEFVPPSHIIIETGGAPAGSNIEKGDYSQASLQIILNGITPETETTTHYFWSSARDYALDDPTMTDRSFKEVYKVFIEDVDMIAAQQRIAERDLDPYFMDRGHDSAAMEARRIIDGILAAESGAAAAE